jgi:hypothetical protein
MSCAGRWAVPSDRAEVRSTLFVRSLRSVAPDATHASGPARIVHIRPLACPTGSGLSTNFDTDRRFVDNRVDATARGA